MEKKKYTYDLTFEEVLEEIWYKGGWYQDNNMLKGEFDVIPSFS